MYIKCACASLGCCRGAKWKLRASAAAASSSFYCGGESIPRSFGSGECIFHNYYTQADVDNQNFIAHAAIVSVDLEMHFLCEVKLFQTTPNNGVYYVKC